MLTHVGNSDLDHRLREIRRLLFNSAIVFEVPLSPFSVVSGLVEGERDCWRKEVFPRKFRLYLVVDAFAIVMGGNTARYLRLDNPV